VTFPRRKIADSPLESIFGIRWERPVCDLRREHLLLWLLAAPVKGGREDRAIAHLRCPTPLMIVNSCAAYCRLAVRASWHLIRLSFLAPLAIHCPLLFQSREKSRSHLSTQFNSARASKNNGFYRAILRPSSILAHSARLTISNPARLYHSVGTELLHHGHRRLDTLKVVGSAAIGRMIWTTLS
jgi:hypothetical protein